MALSLLSPSLSPLSHSFKNLSTISTSHCTVFSSLSPFTSSPVPLLRAYCSSKDGATSEKPSVRSLDDELLRRLSGAKDADQVFVAITESGGSTGVFKIDTSDCNSLIAAAFERGNAELPLSLFDAMRLGFSPGPAEQSPGGFEFRSTISIWIRFPEADADVPDYQARPPPPLPPPPLPDDPPPPPLKNPVAVNDADKDMPLSHLTA